MNSSRAFTVLLFLLIILMTDSVCQDVRWHMPVLPDTTSLGRYTSRTMNLLQKSTIEHRNKVRILVYGQSISEQEWWLEVRRAVKDRFPDADIIMENKAIGGFSTQYLRKTAEMDVSSFYPDLVILHVYGSDTDYEKVLATIRGRTASEIAIMTDHFIGENRWSDTMSYHILPALAEKYKCDLINIRDPWKEYLKDQKLEPAALLRDGIHLNDYGNFLMAELVKPLFSYKSKYEPDPLGLQTDYSANDGLKFKGDTLTFTFTGNRADLFADLSKTCKNDTMIVLLDGRRPSSFQGTYYMSRPFSSSGRTWPWDLPAMIWVDHKAGWIDEDWSLVYTEAKPPYDDFTFSISGSKTGHDGTGTASQDFISNSGRVLIMKGDAEDGGDWHLKRSYQVLKTTVIEGDTIKWRTGSISSDLLVPAAGSVSMQGIILFQGIPNGQHVLKICCRKGKNHSVELLRIYRPYWNRE